MGRFVGLIHRHPRLLNCLLAEGGDAFQRPADYPLAGWGLGYHQGARVLLQKERVDPGGRVDFPSLARTLQTSDLICHVHRPPEGHWTYENAQPFGHQGWVCAHHGRVPGHEEVRELRTMMLDGVAPFLRRNVQGCSDTEVLFHLYLTELHRHHQLPGVRVDPAGAAEAMRALIARVEGMVARCVGQAQLAELQLTLVVSSGDVLVAAAVGVPLHWRLRPTIPRCRGCSEETDPRERRPPRLERHEDLTATWVVSGLTLDGAAPDPSWTLVPDRTVLWANRSGEVRMTPLGPPRTTTSSGLTPIPRSR